MEFPEHYILVPEAEIENRIQQILPLLQGRTGLFSWPADLYYLSGTNQIGYLILKEGHDPLLLVRRYADRARAESPLQVENLESFRDLGRAVRKYLGDLPGDLGLTLDTIPVREAGRIQKALGNSKVSDLTPALLSVRNQKSPWEISCLEKAAEIGCQAYARIPDLFRPGMTEMALAGALFARTVELGSQGIPRNRSVNGEMYPWHLVAGKNGLRPSRVEAPFGGLGLSPSFPQGPSLDPIQPGVPIVVDFGTCYLGYHCDVTRMFCWGQPEGRVVQALDALKAVEAALLERLVPGALGEELFHLARAKAADLGFDKEFLGLESSRINFVGHGVGLEISEPPFLAAGRPETLRLDQTLALELKIVLPGIGAVGHENTVVVTEKGGRKLSLADEGLTILS